MRKLKIAGIVVVMLLVVGFVAARWLIPTERLVQLAYDRLEAQTGLVAQSSSADVSLMPLGVRLNDLEVQDPHREPGEMGVEAQADQVLVRAGLLSLLRRQPEIHEIRLIRPDVTLTLPPRESEGASDGSTGTAALGLLSIEDGHVTVRTATGRVIEAMSLDQSASVRLDATSVDGDVRGSLGEVRVTDPTREGPMSLTDIRYRIGLSGTTSRLDLDVRELAILGAEFQGPVTLELSPVAAVDGELSVEGSLPKFLNELLALAPPAPRLWDTSGGNVSGSLRLAGRLPASGGDAVAWLKLLRGTGTVKDAEIDLAGRQGVLKGSSTFTLGEARLVLDDARFSGFGAEARGHIETPLMPPGIVTGNLQLDGRLDTVMQEVAMLWPHLPDSLTAGKTPPQDWPALAGAASGQAQLRFPLGRAPSPDEDPIQVELQLDGVRVLHPALSDTLYLASGTVRGGRFGGSADALHLRVPGLEGLWSGRLEGWPGRPHLSGAARLSLLDIDQLRPPDDDGQARGWFRVREARAAEPLLAPPASWSADIDVSALRFLARGYEVRDLDGKLTLKNQVVELPHATGDLGGGPIRAQGSLSWKEGGPRWMLNAELNDASAIGVFRPLSPAWARALEAPISGTVSLEGDASADPTVVKSSLSGTGVLRTGQGHLDLKPLLGDGLATVLGADAERLARLTLRSLATVLRIETGRVHIKDLVVHGPTFLRADGWVGFDGVVDYRVDVRLPQDYEPQGLALRSLSSMLRDDQGRIRFAVTVRGPARSPSIGLDTGGARQRAEDAVRDRAEDRLEAEARERLGGLKDKLGGLLGGGKPAEPAPEAAPDTTGGKGGGGD